MVIHNELSLGQLGQFTEYSMNIVWPMEMLGWLTNDFSSALASNKKIKTVYANKPEITNPKYPVRLDHIDGAISFDHVSFVHNEQEILKDISFSVEAGKTIGIMGATGAGKTSIINLLQRLYDTSEGVITLDGHDIKHLALKDLRSSISLVMQDVFLFSDTVLENIKLGKRDVTDFSLVQHAAQKAKADDFIESMDLKYETIIRERGVGLSGGQKQRISIARALAKHTPVLVLDDSTSALDMETESFIQQSLLSLEHTTKIIIAHRISAVRHASEILFLDHGRIIERGTHEELLAKKGLYYETYLAQYGEFLGEEYLEQAN